MPVFNIKSQRPYIIKKIEKIPTPRLLVFQDRVERNIERMRNYLEYTVPGSGFSHLCPHVKTHKSSLITKMMLDAGISSFKTTLNEVDLLARSNAKEIFVAYPLLAHGAKHVAELMSQYPETKFYVQIGSLTHADILRKAAEDMKMNWHYFIDVDVGMHRTGILPARVFELYSEVSTWPRFQFAGLHGYDGHIHQIDDRERSREANRAMNSLLNVVYSFEAKGVSIPRIVVAGSPTFRIDFEILVSKISGDTLIQVSPGTWIYWDSEYDKLMPGEFEIAALILAQVIEVGEENRITLNLGHKRWGADRGPVEVFSEQGLKMAFFNEEHTVLEWVGKKRFKIGDYVLICPKHVCSTVNLYEDFTLIGEDGQIEVFSYHVDGRNR